MAMRSSLAKDIFADELHNEYVEQTTVRDTLKSDWKELIKSILSALETSTEPHTEIEEKLILLAERLRRTSGKKVYGYLKKDVKNLIDSIVDLIGNDVNIAKLYDLWWEKKCEILRTYYQNIPQKKPPLSQNKEFKSLKNDIIREAMKIGVAIGESEKKAESDTAHSAESHGHKPSSGTKNHSHNADVHHISAMAVTGLFRSLGMTFQDKLQRYEPKKNYVDKRQKQEEEEKRNAEFTQSM